MLSNQQLPLGRPSAPIFGNPLESTSVLAILWQPAFATLASSMANKCLFCGNEGMQLSNEHVVPKWLLEYLQLPDDDQLFQAIADTTTGELTEAPRVHSTFNFVQGSVCKIDCNEGWLNRLEEQARPLLKPLMDNTISVTGLNTIGRSIVGKWAVKTAYLHTWASPLKRPVPVEHLRPLYGDFGLPLSTVSVFAMQHAFKQPSAYVQSWFWPQWGRPYEKSPGESPDDAYKIGMQFKHLYLLVVFWPNPNSTFMLMPFHTPVVPITGPPWPVFSGRVPVGSGPIDTLVGFTNWLMAWNQQ